VATIGERGTMGGVENEMEMTRVITAQQKPVKHWLAAERRLRMGKEVRQVEPVPAEKLDVVVLGIRNQLVSSEDGSRVPLGRIRERQEREGVPLMTVMSVPPREVDQIGMVMDQQQGRLKGVLLQVMVRVEIPTEVETCRPLDVLRHGSHNGRFVPIGVGEVENANLNGYHRVSLKPQRHSRNI
jgi:hypothetical protein